MSYMINLTNIIGEFPAWNLSTETSKIPIKKAGSWGQEKINIWNLKLRRENSKES